MPLRWNKCRFYWYFGYQNYPQFDKSPRSILLKKDETAKLLTWPLSCPKQTRTRTYLNNLYLYFWDFILKNVLIEVKNKTMQVDTSLDSSLQIRVNDRILNFWTIPWTSDDQRSLIVHLWVNCYDSWWLIGVEMTNRAVSQQACDSWWLSAASFQDRGLVIAGRYN